MNDSPFGLFLPKSYREKDGSIWVEQPDGSYKKINPFTYQRWIRDHEDVLCAAAWATLTVVD